jgi:hypothetical protein
MSQPVRGDITPPIRFSPRNSFSPSLAALARIRATQKAHWTGDLIGFGVALLGVQI